MPDLDTVYSFLWAAHADDYEILDRSLGPRSWEFVFDMAAAVGVRRDSLVADVGCGSGKHCFQLAKRFGCRVIGIDLVHAPLRSTVAEESDDSVQLVQGSIEQLPILDGSVDFVWCRDMLVHVAELLRALRECARILKPAGEMLLYTTMETDLMEPREAARLYRPLAIYPLRRDALECALDGAGFRIAQVEEIGSELIEYYEERDGRASKRLMRIARMRRMKEQLVNAWGTERYESIEALYYWMTYLLLGKLTAAYYVLQKE